MDPIFLDFGDVFLIGDQDYVYLGSTIDTVYAALILSQSHTRMLEDLVTRKVRQGESVADNAVLCHVVLTTEQFDSRAVFLGNPSASAGKRNRMHTQLNEDDLKQLKEEILTGPTAPVLKGIVVKLTK